MNRFRKKPVVIEAQQFTEETKNQVFNWISCTRQPDWDADGKPTLRIQTLEGEMTARLGDWVIKGIKGEFYPCKPDIFAATYEDARASSPDPAREALVGALKDVMEFDRREPCLDGAILQTVQAAIALAEQGHRRTT